MKRKVNLVGPNTLTVSLPSKWAKENKIKKGTEMEIETEGKSITFTAEPLNDPARKEISVHLTEAEKTVVRIILGAYYQKGYDVINVTYSSQGVHDSVKSAVESMIGMELVEMGPKGCKIKSYLGHVQEDLPQIINKLLNIIKAMQAKVKECYSSKMLDCQSEIDQYWAMGWKHRDLCVRMLHEDSRYEGQSTEYYLLLWLLEKINTNYRRIYRKLVLFKAYKPTAAAVQYLEDVEKMFGYTCSCLERAEPGMIEELNRRHDAMLEKGFKLLRGKGLDPIMATYLMDNVRFMKNMGSPMIMLHLERK